MTKRFHKTKGIRTIDLLKLVNTNICGPMNIKEAMSSSSFLLMITYDILCLTLEKFQSEFDLSIVTKLIQKNLTILGNNDFINSYNARI